MDFYDVHAFVAADSDHSSLRSGNHDYPVSSFSDFQTGKPSSRLCEIPGESTSFRRFALLVVYCLKDVSLLSGSHGIPEALGMGLTALLHLWRRQMLLSMAGGTLFYMFLVQYIF